MRDVILAGAVRTPVGSFGGALAPMQAWELGAIAIAEALRRAGIAPDQVDEVLMGNILQAGQGQGPARQAAMKAGIPQEVPATTINMLCASGLKAVTMAAQAVRAGDAEVVVAGGMESMSNAPYLLEKARTGYRMGDGALIDSMMKDALVDAFHRYPMGITAENLAEKYGLSRQEQDEFAARSQQLAEAAVKSGRFSDEIVPVPVPQRKGDPILADTDEYPRFGTTAQTLAALKPAFKKDGTVTAGNASGINDGAAAVVVMSAEAAIRLGVTPQARLLGSASCGVDPAIMGIGPAHAVPKALQRAGRTLADLDLIEANEAFAAQSLAVGRELKWDLNRVNVSGGAIAIGHPVGASGARILVTLLHEMARRQSRTGVATLCVGGGMGIAAVVERA